MADNDITIAIKTTADTTGAVQTTESLKGVESEVKILDSNQKMSLDAKRASEAEFTAWQAEQMAQRKGTVSALATETVTAEEAAETAARRAANQATIAAAEQEAAAVRAARASAEKALAEEAAAVKIEVALAKETAAAEAQAIADQAIAEKKILNAAIRAGLPRNRQLSAAMSIANSPAAMAAIINPATLAAGAIVALGVISSKVFGGIEEDMNKATEAGSKFEAENVKMSAAIHLLGSPWQAVKTGISGAWDMVTTAFSNVGSDAIELGEKIMGTHHMANLKIEADNARDVANWKATNDQKAQIHEAFTKKILADELALHAAVDNLAMGREQRAGTSSDQVAANDIAREIKKNADENAKIIDAIATAKAVEARSIGADAIAAGNEWRKLTEELTQKQKIDAINLTNKAEESTNDVNKVLESKLTDNAKELQTSLKEIIDSQGPNAAPITKIALSQIEALLSDDKITADEAGKLEQVMRLYRQWTAKTQDQQKFVVDLMASDKEAVDTAKKLSDQINQSTQNQAEVTTSVQAAGEAQQTHHTETVSAIATLAPTSADKQAVVTAVQDTGKAIADKDNAIIAALTAIQTGIASVTQKIAAQQTQIENLFSRIR